MAALCPHLSVPKLVGTHTPRTLPHRWEKPRVMCGARARRGFPSWGAPGGTGPRVPRATPPPHKARGLPSPSPVARVPFSQPLRRVPLRRAAAPSPATSQPPQPSPPLVAAGRRQRYRTLARPHWLTGEKSRCHQYRHLQGPWNPAAPLHGRRGAGCRAARRRSEDTRPHRRTENAERLTPEGKLTD